MIAKFLAAATVFSCVAVGGLSVNAYVNNRTGNAQTDSFYLAGDYCLLGAYPNCTVQTANSDQYKNNWKEVMYRTYGVLPNGSMSLYESWGAEGTGNIVKHTVWGIIPEMRQRVHWGLTRSSSAWNSSHLQENTIRVNRTTD